MKRFINLAVWGFAFCLSQPLHAATFNVTDSAGFQSALDSASNNGDDSNTINLAAGNYSSNGGFTYSAIDRSLTLVGANVDASDDATVISSSSGDGITFLFTGSVQVSGITVQDSDTGLVFSESGDALIGSALSVTLQNSHFTGNSNGGVVIANEHMVGAVEVRDCIFDHNTKSSQGAGLYVLTQNINSPITLTGSTFDHNTPPDPDQPHALLVGGGAFLRSEAYDDSSPITVGGMGEGDGNAFTSNTALSGGGIDIYTLSSVSFVGNTLRGNSADPEDFSATGGAVGIRYVAAAEFSHNIVQDNSAFSSGGLLMGPIPGGIESTLVLNANLFSGNSSKDCGGANLSFYTRGAPLLVTNNIFVDNYVETQLATAGALCIAEPNNPWDDPEDIDVINNTFVNNAAVVDPLSTYVGALSIQPQQAGVVVNLYNNIFYKNISAFDMKDVYISAADPAWGGLNFFNNNVVNADPSNTKNVCIEDPNDSYQVKCNDGSDFSTLPDTTVSGSANPYSLYEVDPVFFAQGNLADYYSLSANSPLIQAGDPDAPQLPEFDYTGTVPMDTPKPDLGALQYCVPSLSIEISSSAETVVLGESLTWTISLPNSANCASNDNTLALTFTNSSYESGDLASASLAKKLASVLHASSGSVSCTGSGSSATCEISAIPNASSVSLSVVASTQALGPIGLSATLSNALGTASASGSASATVVPGGSPPPLDLSGAGCGLAANASPRLSTLWVFMCILSMMIITRNSIKGES